MIPILAPLIVNRVADAFWSDYLYSYTWDRSDTLPISIVYANPGVLVDEQKLYYSLNGGAAQLVRIDSIFGQDSYATTHEFDVSDLEVGSFEVWYELKLTSTGTYDLSTPRVTLEVTA